MVRRQGDRLKQSETKSNIIKHILEKLEPVSEPEIRKHLQKNYQVNDQGSINRHLHELKKAECIEFFPPEKKGLSNYWGITKLKTLEKMIKEYPGLLENLQNSELALQIVLDALEDALVSSTNLKKTKEYIEEYNKIKEHLSNIREDLIVKLKMSSGFFKLCIQDEYSLYRNLSDLMEISEEGPHADAFIGDGFKLFINHTSGIDVAFTACVAMDIMERKGNIRKNMKKEIEYIKQMKNTVSKKQLEQLEKYYEKTRIAPFFIKDKKFVSVRNPKLSKLQHEFEDKGGEWDSLDNKESGSLA